MNISYLDTLPEVANTYEVKLEEGEKVVLAQNLNIFGDEKGRLLGQKCEFTMTNKRFIIYNHAGIWTTDIAKEVTTHGKITDGFWIFKSTYYAVNFNETVVYDNGNAKLNGYRFYFEAPEMEKFEEIMSKLS